MKPVAAATLVFAITSLSFVSGDAEAALQMYKCIAAGRTVYQQTACAADAEPASAAAATPVRAASMPARAASNVGKSASASAAQVRPEPAIASSVPARPR